MSQLVRWVPELVTVATTPAQRLAVPACSSIQSYQPSPRGLSGRPVHRPFRGLLGVHSRYGLHTRAVTVCRDTLHRRLQPFRYLHSCSGCFRLERLPGGTCTHWKSAALSRRTPTGVIQPGARERQSGHLLNRYAIMLTERLHGNRGFQLSGELRRQWDAVEASQAEPRSSSSRNISKRSRTVATRCGLLQATTTEPSETRSTR